MSHHLLVTLKLYLNPLKIKMRHRPVSHKNIKVASNARGK